MRASYTKVDAKIDALIAGDTPLQHEKVTIPAGTAALKRGAVLGKITVGGKVKLSASASNDGSEVPHCILAEDVPAVGGADVTAMAYTGGEFLASQLTLGAGHTAASIKEVFRDKGVYLRF